MAKSKQKSLAKQLAEMLSALEALRDRLKELRYSTEFLIDDITLYFAVDFSEIFSYLHLTREAEANVKILGVTLDHQNLKQNVLQYRLGLTYLFDSFTQPLYILPSHSHEIWVSYVGDQADKKVSVDQAASLLEGIRTLGQEPKQLLESLINKEQSKAVSQKLLDFVKSADFAPLCLDVSEFVSWYKSAHALKGLLDEGVISPRIEALLAKYGIHISKLKEPVPYEIDEIVNMFPPKTRALKPFATRIDARALLSLRNINRLLSRVNARLILITRDANLLEIAKNISAEPRFGWPEAKHCLRGIETMFLDLMLTSTPSIEAKSKWILESELLLARLQRSVGDRLEQIRHDGSGSHVSSLFILGKQILKETAHLWDQHINVKLSLAHDSTTPLGRAFLGLSGQLLPVNITQLGREYQILKNLLEYFSTDIYRTAAIEDVQAVWDGMDFDLWRDQLLNIGPESLGELFNQTFITSSPGGPTHLHSKRPFKMPPIRFISNTYQHKLQALRTETGDKYMQVLLSIIKEVVTSFDEPEDIFFMAYLAGLLDHWRQAQTLGEKCRKMILRSAASSSPAKINPPEVDFFLATIKMRLGRTSADVEEAVNLYLDAYKDIERARAAVPDDPRYMMTEAAIALQYDEQKFGVWPGYPQVLSRDEAIAQLKYALALATLNNDTEYRIKILNNLIFAEVFAADPEYDVAESYIEQMNDALNKATAEEALRWSGFVLHVKETKVMLRARRARCENNLNTLRDCLGALQQINSDSELIQHERASFSSHIEQVKSWINELESPAATAPALADQSQSEEPPEAELVDFKSQSR